MPKTAAGQPGSIPGSWPEAYTPSKFSGKNRIQGSGVGGPSSGDFLIFKFHFSPRAGDPQHPIATAAVPALIFTPTKIQAYGVVSEHLQDQSEHWRPRDGTTQQAAASPSLVKVRGNDPLDPAAGSLPAVYAQKNTRQYLGF